MSYDLLWLYDVHVALQDTLSDYEYDAYPDTTRLVPYFRRPKEYTYLSNDLGWLRVIDGFKILLHSAVVIGLLI
jgi:hypothetical protein